MLAIRAIADHHAAVRKLDLYFLNWFEVRTITQRTAHTCNIALLQLRKYCQQQRNSMLQRETAHLVFHMQFHQHTC
jgi:hypothetical protein